MTSTSISLAITDSSVLAGDEDAVIGADHTGCPTYIFAGVCNYIGVFINMLPNMSQASRRLRQWLLSYNNQNLLCTFGRWKSLPFFEVKLIKTIKITFVLKHLIWSLWFPGFWMWTARLSITMGTKMSLCYTVGADKNGTPVFVHFSAQDASILIFSVAIM